MKDSKPIKIAVTGPESSGKTTLAAALAKRYATIWTPEYARPYLTEKGGVYTFADLGEIARGQLEWEDRDANQARGYHFCDTDLTVIKVWSAFRFGKIDPFILEQLSQPRYALTLLCHPDIPWVFDPLRENPDNRHVLLSLFQQTLQSWNVPYVEIRGIDFSDRLNQAANAIDTRSLF